MSVVPPGYYERLARVESGNNPFARAGSSSASGLYQFTKRTWEGLGFNWSDRFNVDIQNAAAQKLTVQNATQLLANGINPDAGALYAAHFLGGGKASALYKADPSSPIGQFVSVAQIAANPNVFKGIKTVGDFQQWASGKMGGFGKAVSNVVSVFTGSAADATKAAGVAAMIASGNYAAAAQLYATEAPGDRPATGIDGFIEWIKNLFSANTAARVVAVLVGIILVGVALVALTGADKVIINGAKTIAKTAAIAA